MINKKMNVIKFLEFVQNDFEPIKSFYLKDELNPVVWNGFKINPVIRKKLLKIAKDFYKNTDLKASIKDIILIGSLSNYNWSEYSDFDLHIVVDFNDINKDKELVSNITTNAKKNWNDEHDIKISGFEVEVYIQDIDEAPITTGSFSLMKNKWIIKPEKKIFSPDEENIRLKAEELMQTIDELEKEDMPYNKFEKKLNKVWNKVKDFRKKGLLTDDGELSTGNLIFKLLRRNGYISKIVKLKKIAYDKQFE